MHHFQGEPGSRKSIAPSRKLWTALHALDGYLTGQSDWLVNYAERHRAGLRVGTAITEGTANFLVNRRMNKCQQMRWSRRGADLLLQVRCAVYNGTFGSDFGQKVPTRQRLISADGASRVTPNLEPVPPPSATFARYDRMHGRGASPSALSAGDPPAEITRGRTDRGSSPCSMPRRRHPRTPPPHRRSRRLPPGARSCEFEPKIRSTRVPAHFFSPVARSRATNTSVGVRRPLPTSCSCSS